MLRYITAPLVGALIGYCTNYIAVKMLFYPRKEIRIMGHRLPFTPGAIPKGKPRLARAIGNTVANELLTENDIYSKLISDEVENKIIEMITAKLDNSINTIGSNYADDAQLENIRKKLAYELTTQIITEIKKLDINSIIIEHGGKAIKSKTQGTMLSMFVTDNLIASLSEPIGKEIESYINNNGEDKIKPIVESKISELSDKSVLEILNKYEISQDSINQIIISVYENVVSNNISTLLKTINISQLVEDKINQMEIAELEKIIMQVMKKELNTIVNLGAIIGFVIGIINIFI